MLDPFSDEADTDYGRRQMKEPKMWSCEDKRKNKLSLGAWIGGALYDIIRIEISRPNNDTCRNVMLNADQLDQLAKEITIRAKYLREFEKEETKK